MFGFLRQPGSARAPRETRVAPRGERTAAGVLDRRRLLRLGGMGAAGVTGAALVNVLDASPAAAGTDGDVVLSADNVGNGATRTALIDHIAKTEIFGAFQNADSGAAVRGRAGLASTAFPWSKNKDDSYGVWGESREGTGVSGVSDTGTGVSGRSSGGPGVVGSSQAGNGVDGSSSFGAGVSGSSRNGTGVAASNYVGRGVSAFSEHGTGVGAASDTGTGVEASSQFGSALNAHTDFATAAADAVVVRHDGVGRGLSVTTSNAASAADAVTVTQQGTGAGVNVSTTANAAAPAVQATSGSAQSAIEAIGEAVPEGGAVAAAGNGAALSVQGIAGFTRSGAVTLAAPAASVKVPVPGGLAAQSNVLALLQTDTGTIAVRAAVPHLATGKVTIYFNAAAPAGTKVAWFVLG
jgi:hypothetical protein